MSYKERGTLQAETADPKESIYHTVGYKLDALRFGMHMVRDSMQSTVRVYFAYIVQSPELRNRQRPVGHKVGESVTSLCCSLGGFIAGR